MSSDVVVEARIDAATGERAAAVLEQMGLTVSDAVRIFLTRTAEEGALPFEVASDSAQHDGWFRTKVQQAIDDPRPALSSEDVESRMAQRKSAVLERIQA